MIHKLKAPFAAASLFALALAGSPVLAQDAAQAPSDNPAQQGERLDRQGREGRKGRAGRGGGRHGRGGMFGRAAELIGLTDEQRTRIDEIRKADGEAHKAARSNVAAKRRSLEEAMAAEPVSQSTVDSMILELSAAQTEMMRLSTGTRMKVMQVLTPEQRTKLKEARSAHKGGHHKR
ncbi:MAG: Spy/CpxP family protein refolding chaperone [Blastocatellia bacterium]|jgi:Spy/CpxP family protein refolding chaperone|nr:Spy/CpxP family protein refolding chaperone [Blastocatellia bacterium]